MLLAKSAKTGGVTLRQHLLDVALVIEKIGINNRLNVDLLRKGALLHDIGKASFLFQETLQPNYKRSPDFIFRHELASLFFISLVNPEEKADIVRMIVAHHKSPLNDDRELGIVDLYKNMGLDRCFEIHYKGFDTWQKEAMQILIDLDFPSDRLDPLCFITKEEALDNFKYALSLCRKKDYGFSELKGALMAADHLASSLTDDAKEIALERLFIHPVLNFYNRTSDLYPLSLINTDNGFPHTLVTAPTGAGKTDFLMRRCKGRVFYILPFQASINAMYDRFKKDLAETNAEIHLLHASAAIKLADTSFEERILQRYIGASIKVMTPHQIASIVFAVKGYEAMLTDLKECDVILDEIHTYNPLMQSIVYKIVELLLQVGCRVHIGTATMPTCLYKRLYELLGGTESVFEVRLSDEVLDQFDRHRIHKVDDIELILPLIDTAVAENKKILIVINSVGRAQTMYKELAERYPTIEKMLIHSKYKRKDRIMLESRLKQELNNLQEKSCIVVSTQVVEVSLDISFDVMITECAPIDAMIQRFGRINRKRIPGVRKIENIYVIAPPESKTEALPYDLNVLERSFACLPNSDILHEKDVQGLIDMVYPEMDMPNIGSVCALVDGEWQIRELQHYGKSALYDVIEVDATGCITQSDVDNYKEAFFVEQAGMEIPVSYKSIAYKELDQIKDGSGPFVIPNMAYDEELGYLKELSLRENYDVTTRFL